MEEKGRYNEIVSKVRHYEWLVEIAEKYYDMIRIIEVEKDHFCLCGFSYTARCDGRKFELNPHRTIPVKYILDGLKNAYESVMAEIKECKKELDGRIK